VLSQRYKWQSDTFELLPGINVAPFGHWGGTGRQEGMNAHVSLSRLKIKSKAVAANGLISVK
jgi:hypothetical protein